MVTLVTELETSKHTAGNLSVIGSSSIPSNIHSLGPMMITSTTKIENLTPLQLL